MGEEKYLKLIQEISSAQNILLTTHEYPDADGLGSQVALCEALSLQKKSFCALNEAPLISRYQYLDPSNYIHGLGNQVQQKWDLAIVIDTNKISRCGQKMEKLLKTIPRVIYIDHHPLLDSEGDQFYINTQAAATGQMIGELIHAMNIPFNVTMALALYTAILIDTNSFRYPSVTAQTHRLISHLLATGMSSHRAYNMIYGSRKLDQMHLLGHILLNTQSNAKGDIGWIYIKEKELKKYHSEIEDTHAYINNLLSLEGIKVACMFREENGNLKLSLRSHGDIDVGEIALKLGGGGHSHSAATVFEIKGKKVTPSEKIQSTIQTIEKLIAHLSLH